MTDVKIKWEDNKITIESFRNEQEFFDYLKCIKKDTGIGTKDFETYPINPNWCF